MADGQTLASLQRQVLEFERTKGLDHQTARDKCLLLGEEVGELFKAVRQVTRLGHDSNSQQHELADELADVTIYLLAIANRFDVDLGAAVARKLALNYHRDWGLPKGLHDSREVDDRKVNADPPPKTNSMRKKTDGP